MILDHFHVAYKNNSRYINDIYVAWRKVIRKLFKLPYRTHNYLVCGIVECITVSWIDVLQSLCIP